MGDDEKGLPSRLRKKLWGQLSALSHPPQLAPGHSQEGADMAPRAWCIYYQFYIYQ